MEWTCYVCFSKNIKRLVESVEFIARSVTWIVAVCFNQTIIYYVIFSIKCDIKMQHPSCNLSNNIM